MGFGFCWGWMCFRLKIGRCNIGSYWEELCQCGTAFLFVVLYKFGKSDFVSGIWLENIEKSRLFGMYTII